MSASEYRKQAERCFAEAATTRDEQSRVTWEGMGQRWLAMADTARAVTSTRPSASTQTQAQQQQQPQIKQSQD